MGKVMITGVNPIPMKPLVAHVPPKSKPGTFGKTTKGTTREGQNIAFKKALMGRSKLPVKNGTQSSAILD